MHPAQYMWGDSTCRPPWELAAALPILPTLRAATFPPRPLSSNKTGACTRSARTLGPPISPEYTLK